VNSATFAFNNKTRLVFALRWALRWALPWALALVMGTSAACGSKKTRTPATYNPPTESAAPPPATAAPPAPPESDLSRVDESDDILSMSLEDINAQQPLADIRFGYDSADLTAPARESLDAHAAWLRRHSTVTILIEGHCDERGTVEYNLALGERRAAAAYNYLVNLGVPSARLKTISYGKEFPVDPDHNEAAWARNRRDHFIITSK
jgi:peptidoglycan-associated lipoprotein